MLHVSQIGLVIIAKKLEDYKFAQISTEGDSLGDRLGNRFVLAVGCFHSGASKHRAPRRLGTTK